MGDNVYGTGRRNLSGHNYAVRNLGYTEVQIFL